MTAHLEIVNDRLLHGFTFAESAYMATRALSWMTVVVGDPLYRPFASWLQLDPKRSERSRNNWEQYRDFALKNTGADPVDYFNLARKAASRANNGSMIEDLGLIEKESGEFDDARSARREKQRKLLVLSRVCSGTHRRDRRRSFCRKSRMKFILRPRRPRRARPRYHARSRFVRLAAVQRSTASRPLM